jgi:predicted flap endonuclease-1-like 5' DNA nuclease
MSSWAIEMLMDSQPALAQLKADLEERRSDLRAAEALFEAEALRLAGSMPVQLEQAQLELTGLRAHIQELEQQCGRLSASEAHFRAMVQAKDEEIASLIRRLKDYERIQARLRELEPQAEADDLKRIYGIGPVLEKKLNELGVHRFEQIGRWSDAEIESFQAQMPEARVRRDAWVKGAREEYFRKYRKALV